MSENIQQRSFIKICARNGITAVEVLRMLEKVFGEQTLSRSSVFEWHKLFIEGRESVEDEQRAPRQRISTDKEHVKQIKEIVLKNRRLTIRDLADTVGISVGSVNTILKDFLCLRRVKSRLVPKTLNFLEKQRRVEVCETMLSDYHDKMKCMITGDETWIYAYDPKVTDQSSEYRAKGEARPKRSRRSRSKIKVMLTIFFDYRGVVYYEFLPANQTVNKEYYLSVMRRLREAIRLKRPDLWKDNSWFLHHDNAPAHTALILRDHFAKNSTNIVPQPPYSPDLAPCDFWLFSKLKRTLRGNRFDSIEEIKDKSKKELMAIPAIEFEKCFEEWKTRWHKCIASDGDYFEGDEIDLDE